MKKLLLILSIFVIVIAIGVLVGIGYYQSMLIQNYNQNNNTSSTTSSTESQLDLTLVPHILTVADKFKSGALAEQRGLNLPAGFEVSVFTAGLKGPRFFDFDPANNMYVADKDAGKIYFLTDEDEDGVADENIVFDEGLRNPHSVDYYEGNLYLGEEHQVVVYTEVGTDGKYTDKKILVPNLPTGGHSTRTVLVGPDEKLYVSIGSSCNVCEESDPRRAAVVRYNLDGTGEELFATGLRNSVGIVFAPTGESEAMELWSVDNGRDLLGDDLPPEEVNVLTKGAHYGWPYCYGNGVVNPEFPTQAGLCATNTTFPRYNMQAHSAPLGLAFNPSLYGAKSTLPMSLKQYLFIAFHGSWNRSLPTGYKLVTIDTSDNQAEPIDFITGWQDDTTTRPWGRPVGIGFDHSGIMYVSDDHAGIIYRIVYAGN